MSIELHLFLQEITLLPSGEWTPDNQCWTTLRVADGYGYSLHDGPTRELKTGDTIIVSPNANVILRASQLGKLKLEFFTVVLQRLYGLITAVEWRQLERLSHQTTPHVFYHAANEALAQKFARLAKLAQRDNLSMRSALLQLWASSVTSLFLESDKAGAGKNKLRERFREFFGKISEKELTAASLSDLASQLNCSERHFTRLFREEFGMSFRKCQTELCLQHAQVLLSDATVKISTVAAESGYQHRGFFNATFKKRFGVSPNEWRRQNLTAPTQDASKRIHSLLTNGGISAAGQLKTQN